MMQSRVDSLISESSIWPSSSSRKSNMQSVIRVRNACSAFPHSSSSSIASPFVFAFTMENSVVGQFEIREFDPVPRTRHSPSTEIDSHELRLATLTDFAHIMNGEGRESRLTCD